MTAADLLRAALTEDPGYTPAGFGAAPREQYREAREKYSRRGLTPAGYATVGQSAGRTRYLDVWAHPGMVPSEDSAAGVLYWDGPCPEPRVVPVTPVTTYQLAADENWRD